MPPLPLHSNRVLPSAWPGLHFSLKLVSYPLDSDVQPLPPPPPLVQIAAKNRGNTRTGWSASDGKAAFVTPPPELSRKRGGGGGWRQGGGQRQQGTLSLPAGCGHGDDESLPVATPTDTLSAGCVHEDDESCLSVASRPYLLQHSLPGAGTRVTRAALLSLADARPPRSLPSECFFVTRAALPSLRSLASRRNQV
jgi:hypothetical protein